jgi:hypothetical protein
LDRFEDPVVGRIAIDTKRAEEIGGGEVGVGDKHRKRRVLSGRLQRGRRRDRLQSRSADFGILLDRPIPFCQSIGRLCEVPERGRELRWDRIAKSKRPDFGCWVGGACRRRLRARGR